MSKLALASIRTDGGTQPRAEISIEMVERYQEEIEAGAKFPPLIVFHDGTDHWLADGFHRYRALRAAKVAKAECDVRQGTQRDAVLYSVGANATHGLPRTNADKRRAVETLLRDEEWSKKSDRWIAEKCAVGNQLVSVLRKQLCESHSSPTTGKDGKTRKRPSPPKKLSEPLDVAPESNPLTTLVEGEARLPAETAERLSAVVAATPTEPTPRLVAAPAPTPEETWEREQEMRAVSAAMKPLEALAASWPAGNSYRFFIDCLRGLADRLEGQEEEKAWRQAN